MIPNATFPPVSASWITDHDGDPVQHLQYLPYGEPYVDQRTSGYSERFTFTGKERDEETGYGYFGARYMDHELMTMWLSVDPLADKYPNISPYNYCMWNPVKLVDPNGKDTIYSFALTSMNENQNRKNRLIIEWMRSLGDNPALFIISMHGHPEYMEYVNGNDGSNPDQVQKMTPKMLANMIRMGANLYNDNKSKNLQTIF